MARFLPLGLLGIGVCTGLWALGGNPVVGVGGAVPAAPQSTAPPAAGTRVAVAVPVEHRVAVPPPPEPEPEPEPKPAPVGRRPAGLEIEPGWFAAHQDEDGRWDADGFCKHDRGGSCGGLGRADGDIACTSAMILAILAEGSTLRSGPHKGPLKKAVRWLIKSQQPVGAFQTELGGPAPRDHALATYALCEAHGLSNYKTLRKYAQRALDHLGSLQSYASNRDRVLFLGWRIHAFAAAREFRLQVPVGAAERDLAELGRLRGWEPRLAPAVELAGRGALGEAAAAGPVVDALAEEVRRHRLTWGAEFDADRCFFATLALYRLGGSHWRAWAGDLRVAVHGSQRTDDGPGRGSWDPVGIDGDRGGRVYTSALMALALSTSYRYSRLVR